ncbi:hypothetical protein RI129_000095, partial [Pyrocoelia pectoralis]
NKNYINSLTAECETKRYDYSISTTKQFIVLHVFRQPPSFSPTPPPANRPSVLLFSPVLPQLFTLHRHMLSTFITTLPCTTCTFVLPPPSQYLFPFSSFSHLNFPSPFPSLLSIPSSISSLVSYFSLTSFLLPPLLYPGVSLTLTSISHTFPGPSPIFPTVFTPTPPCPPPTSASSSLSLPKSWSGANSQLSPAPPRPTPPLHSSFPSPMFATPLPPPVTSANQADMLRRELDNRFLASQDRTLNIGPPPYLRAEMHQHQHHHTHVHQHTTSILPPPPPSASTLFPSPLVNIWIRHFIVKNMGLPGYPSYSSSLLSRINGPTPFVPPNHLPPFQTEEFLCPQPTPPPDPTKPKIVNQENGTPMHVRIAWEVYHHKERVERCSVKPDLLRTPPTYFHLVFHSHVTIIVPAKFNYAPPSNIRATHPGIFGSTGPHIGLSSTRSLERVAAYCTGISTGRNALPPNVTGLPPPAPWSLKPDPILEQREREETRGERKGEEKRLRDENLKKRNEENQQQERERERERREKERRELERRELERQQERERLLHQQRLAESTKQLGPSMLRDRSPLRNGTMDPNDIRVKEEPRIKEEDRYHPYVRQHPVLQHSLPHMLDRSRVLPPYPPPPTTHWPPSPAEHYYRTYDPLRYNPLMDAAMRAEEERVKLFSAYSHHAQFRPKDPGLLLTRQLRSRTSTADA